MNSFLFYGLWVPLVVGYYTFYGWLSVCLNKSPSVKNVVILSLLGAVPLWPTVATFSKRVGTDALFYDVVMIISCTFSIIIFSGTRFTSWQWLGVAMCVTGLTMIMKTQGG